MSKRSQGGNELRSNPERIRDRCRVIAAALRELSNDPKLYEELLNGIASASGRNLKVLERDLGEWWRGLEPPHRALVNERLKAAGHEPMELSERKRIAEIARILKRRTIASADEYRLVEARVAELCESDPSNAQIGKLNELLSAYEPNPGDD